MLFDFISRKWKEKKILFYINSQLRETKIIWRIFEEFPLFTGLADGLPFPWFAINIPMDLIAGFKGDFDIIACLVNMRDPSRKHERIYKTWEVKTTLIDGDGKSISLKLGKIKNIIKQLKIHRLFGSPDSSLLEIYLCHSDFIKTETFPTPQIANTVSLKSVALSREGFGYQLIPFGHHKDWWGDLGLLSYNHNHSRPPCTILRNNKPSAIGKPFDGLVRILNDFHEANKNEPGLAGFHVITFCKKCKKLVLIGTQNKLLCMYCGRDLTTN